MNLMNVEGVYPEENDYSFLFDLITILFLYTKCFWRISKTVFLIELDFYSRKKWAEVLLLMEESFSVILSTYTAKPARRIELWRKFKDLMKCCDLIIGGSPELPAEKIRKSTIAHDKLNRLLNNVYKYQYDQSNVYMKETTGIYHECSDILEQTKSEHSMKSIVLESLDTIDEYLLEKISGSEVNLKNLQDNFSEEGEAYITALADAEDNHNFPSSDKVNAKTFDELNDADREYEIHRALSEAHGLTAFDSAKTFYIKKVDLLDIHRCIKQMQESEPTQSIGVIATERLIVKIDKKIAIRRDEIMRGKGVLKCK